MTSTTHHDEKLTELQKAAILEAYQESLHDEGVDAIQALEEIRAVHGFSEWEGSAEQERPGELSEEMKREILRGWSEAQRGEVVDALTVLEEIRRKHGF